ncbi:uncharacterized protein LOC113360289 [Papaver somniferum]|uniref:uncharacterized protein LOC113360289 n=1 Tax=Papaver somniferum TaxID=3469 RepID=UPI000E6F49EC|nr:uncharacterized protein LOC113360289 [Papaver somniferum]
MEPVLRSSSQGLSGCSSSSNSKSLDSDPSLDGRFRRFSPSSLPRIRPKAEPRQECTTEQRHDIVRPYATDAMSAYNEATGTTYELVEPGFLTSVYIGPCFLHHIDFTAKKIEVADALEEMFFSELTTRKGVRCVKVCKSMGPKESISGDKNNGCCYCVTYNVVQHPRGRGFSAGGAALFTDERL